jgi:predicted dehydrogenase
MQGAHAPALKRRDDVEVAAIADPNEEAREALGRQFPDAWLAADYEDLLTCEDVDALDVCLPHDMHEPAVLAAFRAGKDVLLEKPIALTLDQADRMIQASKDAGRQFYVLLNQRFFPPHRVVKEKLDSGEHGRPFLAMAQLMGDELARMNLAEHWKGTWQRSGGGALMDTGTHITDLMLWWFGRPRTVSCAWGRYVVEGEHKADDNVSVTLGYEDMLAQYVVSYSVASDPWREDKWFYFNDCSLRVAADLDEPLRIGRDRQPPEPVEVPPMTGWPNWFAGSVGACLDHFLDVLAGKRKPDFGPEAARDALAIVLLAYESAAKSKIMELDL